MSQKRNHWIGFDLGGTKMLANLYDPNFKQIASAKRKTEGHRGKKAGLKRMCGLIEGVLEDADLGPSRLAGIGVGVPGPVDPSAGLIHEAPNLGWEDVEVGEHLHGAFSCPVAVVNDVDAGIYAEHQFGAARGAHTAVGIFPGTGIGGGAVIDGQLVQGSDISCLEIGHIPLALDPKGDPVSLEMLASRLSIAAEAAKAAYRGQAPNLMKECGTDISLIKSSAIARAIEAGDKEIEAIVVRAAHWLGFGVATAVNLLAPNVVVLGGGLVEAMPELFLRETRESADKVMLPPYRGRLRIVAAELADDATARGAAAWVRHRAATAAP